MNQQGSAGTGDAAGGGGERAEVSRGGGGPAEVARGRGERAEVSAGRGRSPGRWWMWVALAAAIVVAAICATDDPEPAGQAGGGDPGDCYTSEADQPEHPRDTNRYVIALTTGDAGAREEYAHCRHLPAQNPSSADGDCYSTGDDNEWRLVGANRYGLALLEAGASAGDLDQYAHCAYLPAMLGSAAGR